MAVTVDVCLEQLKEKSVGRQLMESAAQKLPSDAGCITRDNEVGPKSENNN